MSDVERVVSEAEPLGDVPQRPAVTRRVQGEAVLVAAGQIGAALAGLGGLRMLTTMLVPGEFGRLALGLSIAAFLQQIAFGPISAATLRYAGSAAAEAQLGSFVDALDRILRGAILGSLAVAVLGSVALTVAGRQDWIILGVASLCFAVSGGVSTTILFIEASLRRRRNVAVIQVLTEVFRFGMAAALIVFIARTAEAVMVGFAVSLTIVAIIQVWRNRVDRTVVAGDDLTWRTSIVAFAQPLALTGALSWSQLASDRWSLNAFLSAVHVGAYSVLYQVAVAPFSLLSVMFQQFIGPIVFRMAGRGGNEPSMRASHHVVLTAVLVLLTLTAIGALLAWQWHDFVFRWLVGPRFREFSRLLPLAVIVGGTLAASQLAATTVMSRGDTTRLITPKVVTSILGVCMNVIGAQRFGVAGVLVANGLFAAMFFAWMLWLGSRPGSSPKTTA